MNGSQEKSKLISPMQFDVVPSRGLTNGMGAKFSPNVRSPHGLTNGAGSGHVNGTACPSNLMIGQKPRHRVSIMVPLLSLTAIVVIVLAMFIPFMTLPFTTRTMAEPVPPIKTYDTEFGRVGMNSTDRNIYFMFQPNDASFFAGNGEYTNVLKIYFQIGEKQGYRLFHQDFTHRIIIHFYGYNTVEAHGEQFGHTPPYDEMGWRSYYAYKAEFNTTTYIGYLRWSDIAITPNEDIRFMAIAETSRAVMVEHTLFTIDGVSSPLQTWDVFNPTNGTSVQIDAEFNDWDGIARMESTSRFGREATVKAWPVEGSLGLYFASDVTFDTIGDVSVSKYVPKVEQPVQEERQTLEQRVSERVTQPTTEMHTKKCEQPSLYTFQYFMGWYADGQFMVKVHGAEIYESYFSKDGISADMPSAIRGGEIEILLPDAINSRLNITFSDWRQTLDEIDPMRIDIDMLDEIARPDIGTRGAYDGEDTVNATTTEATITVDGTINLATEYVDAQQYWNEPSSGKRTDIWVVHNSVNIYFALKNSDTGTWATYDSVYFYFDTHNDSSSGQTDADTDDYRIRIRSSGITYYRGDGSGGWDTISDPFQTAYKRGTLDDKHAVELRINLTTAFNGYPSIGEKIGFSVITYDTANSMYYGYMDYYSSGRPDSPNQWGALKFIDEPEIQSIPEFSDLFVPIIACMVAFVVIRKRKGGE